MCMGRPKNFSREEVLEKAMPVFWKHGFADTSLHELERATGVNKSGLYTEFRDKEDLFSSSRIAEPTESPRAGRSVDLPSRSRYLGGRC